MSNRQPFQLTARTLALTDVIPTQPADGSAEVGKNTITEVRDLMAVPKVYVAYLTQVTTGAPTAFIIKNTLGGTVVWARTSAGLYTGTLAGAFPTNNSAPYPQRSLMPYSGTEFTYVETGFSGGNQIVINTFQGVISALVNTDQVLNSFLIKIEVYS